jgi:uncharacterized membrane protein
MIDWLIVFARDLALAVWLGGLIAIDLVEAPARFRTPELDRNQIALVGRQVFRAFNRVETYLASFLLLIVLAWMLPIGAAGGGGRFLAADFLVPFTCLALMLLAAFVQFYQIQPRMYELTGALDFVNRTEDPRYGELRSLHLEYVALDLLKIVLGLVVFGFWTTWA